METVSDCFTQCAGCWRNSNGEEYCVECEREIVAKEKEDEDTDNMGQRDGFDMDC